MFVVCVLWVCVDVFVVGECMLVVFVLQMFVDVCDVFDIVVEEVLSVWLVMQEYLLFMCSGMFYMMDSGGFGYGMLVVVGVVFVQLGWCVIGLIGDGLSLYLIQVLWSVVQLKLLIMFVILNNWCYVVLQDFVFVFGFGLGDLVQGIELFDLDFVVFV